MLISCTFEKPTTFPITHHILQLPTYMILRHHLDSRQLYLRRLHSIVFTTRTFPQRVCPLKIIPMCLQLSEFAHQASSKWSWTKLVFRRIRVSASAATYLWSYGLHDIPYSNWLTADWIFMTFGKTFMTLDAVSNSYLLIFCNG